MIRINQDRGALRSFKQKPLTVEVVTPAGHIKTINFDLHISSPLLTMERAGSRIVSVDLKMAYRDAGWSLLRELYEAEERLDDFEAREDYRAALARGVAGRDDVTADVMTERGTQKITYSVGRQFPDEMLPREVLRRRGLVDGGNRWEPPKKARKSKKQGEPDSAPAA